MKKKVCFIGGSGFVGSRLIDITNENFDVINLDKQQSHFYPEITRICDIRDSTSLASNLAGVDTVVLLAAEHRDDVSPVSLYYDVNVEGTRNVLSAMEKNCVNNIIFTSSVAIYGLNKKNPDESYIADPFNHYGKSKWFAEEILRDWYNKNSDERSLRIIRPTVIFGERNRGNVYNLLKQIASGKFAMIGKGENFKSMAYVGNIVEFINYNLTNLKKDYQVYNYVDKPDLCMNQLVAEVERNLRKKIPSWHIPYMIGLLGGYSFDVLSLITKKKYTISSVRVKKFCATTQFNAEKVRGTDFVAPFTLSEGLNRTLQYEFVTSQKDDITFVTE